MGHAPCQLKPCSDLSWKNNEELWNLLQKGGISNFIERIQGHDQNISVHFAMDWKDKKVDYGGHRVIINEELIAEVTCIKLKGYHFFNKRINRTVEAKKLCDDGEELEFITAGVR
ncbi:hypothetical protein KI387_038019, partial [Taxus chinensis]